MSRELILITGASSDIGVSLIERLAAANGDVLILAHYHSNGDRLAQLQQKLGANTVIPIQANFAIEPEVSAMMDHVESKHGIPRKLVHLPAMKLCYERFAKLDMSRLKQDLAIQLESSIILLRRCLPAMSKMPGARVVFVLSSVVRGMPPSYLTQYSIVKYSQLGLVRSLGSEYAGTHVRVNAISPSMIETQFLSQVPKHLVEASASGNPARRNARPDDVIGALEFLLSDAAEYLSGVDLPVTGGSTA